MPNNSIMQSEAQEQQNAKKGIRYICPFPGCNRSFRDFWRLKVHYRAQPGARGSGVERGHGMELPFCPLCNLDLRDVKYHKCTAGPAACAPARRNSQAVMAASHMNNMGPQQMQLHGPCAAPGHLMMPTQGPFNFAAGQPQSMHPMQQQFQQQQFQQQQFQPQQFQQQQFQQQQFQQQQFQQQQQQQQQQQLIARPGPDCMQSNGQPDAASMAVMQPSSGMPASVPQQGNHGWWANPAGSSTQQQQPQQQALPQMQQQQQPVPQMQMQQQFHPHWQQPQQQQRLMMAGPGAAAVVAPGSNSSGSSGSSGPVGMQHMQTMQQQQPQHGSLPPEQQQQQQQMMQPGLQRVMSGPGAGSHTQAGMQRSGQLAYPLSGPMHGLHRPNPLPALPAAADGSSMAASGSSSMGHFRMQATWHPNMSGHAAGSAQGMGCTGIAARMPGHPSSFNQPQQQMQQQVGSTYSSAAVPSSMPYAAGGPSSMGHAGVASFSGAPAGSSSFTNNLLPADAAAKAAAASGFTPSGPLTMPAMSAMQRSSAFTAGSTLPQFDCHTDVIPNSAETTSEAGKLAHTVSATDLAPPATGDVPDAAAAAPLQVTAASIVDDFKAALDGLRTSISGSTGGQNIAGDAAAGPGVLQQEGLPRGNSGSSCSSSPVSSSAHCQAGNGFGPSGLGAPVPEDVAVQIPVIGVKRSASDHDQDGEDAAADAKRSRLLPQPPAAVNSGSCVSLAAAAAAGMERQGSLRPVSGLGAGAAGGMGRSSSWADTPPPTEAQEALLQLAAHVESEVATVTGSASLWMQQQQQLDGSPAAAAAVPGSNRPGVVHDIAQAQDCDNPHAAQVSQLLATALEAANKCFQDPAPVVQKLLAVLDEHITMLSHRMDTSEGPAAAAAVPAAVPEAAVVGAPAAAAAGEGPVQPDHQAFGPTDPAAANNNAAADATEGAAAAAAEQVQPEQLWQPATEKLPQQQQQQQAVLLPGVAGPVLLQQHNMSTAEAAAQQMPHSADGAEGDTSIDAHAAVAAAATTADFEPSYSLAEAAAAAAQPDHLCVEKVPGTASPVVAGSEKVQA